MNEKIKQLADPVVIIADVMNRKRMNETIKILMYEANKSVNPGAWTLADFSEKFAELIVKECVRECQQEWYDLNNIEDTEHDLRAIAIRVGQKNGILKSISRIKKHFGVEE